MCSSDLGAGREVLTSPILENSGEVKVAGLDASLGPQTWLVVFDAENRKSHAAFSGSARGMTPDGASLSLDSASVRCARVPEGRFSLAPPPAPELPDYLVCMLDEARFAHAAQHILLAQLGARLIDTTAKSMADQFFTRFKEQVEKPATAEAEAASPAAQPETNHSKTVWIMLAIGTAIAIIGWFLAG